MIKFLKYIFNHDQMDLLKNTIGLQSESILKQDQSINVYRERNKQLEDQVKELESYKLKYEITKLYVEDDDALFELFEANELFEKNFKKAENQKADKIIAASQNAYLAQQQANVLTGRGGLGGYGAAAQGQLASGSQLANLMGYRGY